MKHKSTKVQKLVSVLLCLGILFTMVPVSVLAEISPLAGQVAADGVSDKWTQDPATVKGNPINEVTEDNWLHLKAGDGNGNNPSETLPPAVFVNEDFEADFTKEGFFETDIKTIQDGKLNRVGIYLGYKDQFTGMFFGYNADGWYWQKYGMTGDPWSANIKPIPAANSTVTVRIDWTADKRATFSVDEKALFTDVDFSGITELGNKVAVKASKWNTEYTDVYLKNIHYTGQKTLTSYDITGKVIDTTSKSPLSNAVISMDGKPVATTDNNGAYTVLDLLDGTYTLTFEKEGYLSAEETVTVNGGNVTVPDVALEAVQVNETTISSNEMEVKIDRDFPRVIEYTMISGKNNGKTFYGQTVKLDTIKINDVSIVPVVTSKIEGDKAVYTMAVKDDARQIDAVLTAALTVSGNSLAFDITDVKNNSNLPVQSIEIPNHSLISVRSTQEGANLKGAVMSNKTYVSGDSYTAVDDAMVPRTSSYMYAFVSNNELSAGLWSTSDIGSGGAGGNNNRVTAVAEDRGTYKTLGLSSSRWYFDRVITGNVAGQQKSYTVTHLEDEMPHAAVIITGEENGDDKVDWQDGAIAFREIMRNPFKSEEVPELVSYRIAMNFGGQAQNPFLTTLDNVKRIAMHTDGLGQSILLKGYGSEGHDSGHPDYADIGERIGGAEDMNQMMIKGAEYGARFGIHVNASEMYPEAKAFSEEMAQRVGNSSDITYGWNWLDQAVRLNSLFDLGTQNRRSRFNALEEKVGQNMDFVYVDVWGNGYANMEDAWATRYLSDEITSNGWRVAHEWGYANEYESTFQHWATDLNYGGENLQGINSNVMRFLRNHQKDSWVADYYPTYKGGAAIAPLLGGYNMVDFEGWQGGNDYDAYVNAQYTFNVSTKFLQHYQVTNWVDADNTVTLKGEQWRPEKEITLKDKDGDTVVITRKATTLDNMSDYRSRTITLNGKVVLKGEQAYGDLSGKGSESYLLPWIWDAKTGEKVSAADEKLYHWNKLGGTDTWELPDGWEALKSVKYYELTDLGKVEVADIPVVNGTVTLTAEAETPYVIYKGEAKPVDYKWSDGMHIYDAGFNSGSLNHWDMTGTGEAKIIKSSASNPMLGLSGEAAVSQTLTGLTPGQQYAVYVGVDNRSDSKAWISVDVNGTKNTNYSQRSIAKNYVRAYAHNTLSATVDGSSYFQNMYTFFTAPESGTVTLTLEKESGEGIAYFDDVRVVENEADYVKETDENGRIVRFEQNFENNAQGIYPFVIGSIEGVEDNRTHLSQLHAPYTQAGWQTKKLDDVLEGEWSLKVNGLSQRNAMVYQTIPQNFRFEPGVTYEISFDYQTGSDGIYGITYGAGEFKGGTPLKSIPKAMGETKNFSFSLIGDESGQSWFGVYSTSKVPDLQGATGAAENFGGYKDLIIDNLKIEVSDTQKAELNNLIAEANKLFEQDYPADLWADFAAKLTAAKAALDNLDATQAEVDTAVEELKAAMEAMVAEVILGTVSGTVTGLDDEPLAGVEIVLTAPNAEKIVLTTDENGSYEVKDIFIRNYKAKVVMEGYQTLYNQAITIVADENTVNDFALEMKIPAEYTNDFDGGDVSMIQNLSGNSRPGTVTAAQFADSPVAAVTFPGGVRANMVDVNAPKFVNGVFEADVTPVSSGIRFGMVFRGNNMNERIFVGAGDTNGQWFWEHWNGSDNKWSGMYNGPTFGAGETRHLKAELRDNHITLWVDGQLIINVDMTGSIPANAGFVGFECRSGGKFYIDNIEVTSYDDGLAGSTTVSGAVTDEVGNPHLNATVKLYRGDDLAATTKTTLLGEYSITKVMPGDYTLEVEKGGVTITKEITVEADTPLAVEDIIVMLPDKSALIEKIADVEALLEDDEMEYMTEESLDALKATLREAKAMVDGYVSQADVDAMVQKLQDAVDGLRVSKATLEAFLNKAKEHVANGDVDKTVASVQKLFETAIAEGEAVMAAENPTLDEVVKASKQLMLAIQALDMLAGDKTDLKMALDLAAMIDLDKYVEAGQAEYIKALEKAVEVMNDGDAMQEEVNKAWNDLVTTMQALRLKANKDALADLLESLKDLDLGKYTDETVSVYKDAWEKANAVMADKDLSEDDQKVVDDAVQVLKVARDGLKLKDGQTGTGTGTGNNSGTTGNPQSGDAATPLFLILTLISGWIVIMLIRKQRAYKE